MKFQRQQPFTIFLYLVSAILVGVACTAGVSSEDDDQVEVEELASGLKHPWGMAFLPDGKLLVTERDGQLRMLGADKKLSDPVAGVPEVFNEGQGGLLDVALDPDFKSNNYIYISFSEPRDGGATTALGRGKWANNRLNDFQVIFRQEPVIDGPNHFGGRILFSREGNLFLTLGERFQFDPAQDLSNHLGTIVRITREGEVPTDNPFVKKSKADNKIWSYGHRNIEAGAFDPKTGKLWVAEMGPQGGDELNLVKAAKNYGWPLVSWGEHYDGKDIPDPTTRPEFEDSKVKWTPVISPSGMVFYTGNLFKPFQGNMLIGGLTAKGVVRVDVTDEQAREVGRIKIGDRVRDVEQAPDGSIYVLTDKSNGQILRLTPKK